MAGVFLRRSRDHIQSELADDGYQYCSHPPTCNVSVMLGLKLEQAFGGREQCRLQEGNCSPFRGRSAREVAVTPRPARYVVLSGCGGIRRRMISSGLMSSGWLTQDCVRIATSEKPSPMRSAG